MFCTHCGSVIEEGAKFCTNCGAPVEVEQPSFEEPEYKEPEYKEPEYHEPEYKEPETGESGYQEAEYEEKPAQDVKPAQKPSSLEGLSEHLMVGNWNETYLWLMALVPIISGLRGASMLAFILGIVLVVVDYKELQKRNGVKLATWVVVLGALFNFVYLIARPHGTSKNYKPLILFIVLALVMGFLRMG